MAEQKELKYREKQRIETRRLGLAGLHIKAPQNIIANNGVADNLISHGNLYLTARGFNELKGYIPAYTPHKKNPVSREELNKLFQLQSDSRKLESDSREIASKIAEIAGKRSEIEKKLFSNHGPEDARQNPRPATPLTDAPMTAESPTGIVSEKVVVNTQSGIDADETVEDKTTVETAERIEELMPSEPQPAAKPAGVASKPDEQNPQSEDLGKLTVDELTERLYEAHKELVDIDHALDDIVSKAKELNPSLDNLGIRHLTEADQNKLNRYDAVKRYEALRRAMAGRLTFREFTQKLEEVTNRYNQAKAQEEQVSTPQAATIAPDTKLQAATPAGAVPEPNEQNTQPEGLGMLTDDEFSEKLRQFLDSEAELERKIYELYDKSPNDAQTKKQIQDLNRELDAIQQEKDALMDEDSRRTWIKLETQESSQPTSATTPKAPVIEIIKSESVASPANATSNPPRPKVIEDTLVSREASQAPAQSPDTSTRRQTIFRGQVVHQEPPENPQDLNKENVIEHKPGDTTDLMKWLNDHLSTQTKDNVTAIFTPVQVKDYLISIAQGMAQGGSIQVLPNDNLLLKQVKLEVKYKGVPVKATVDIGIGNNPNKNGIEAALLKYKPNAAAMIGGFARKTFAGGNDAREEIESQIASINAAVKTKLDLEIDPKVNPLWRTDRVLISGDKVHIKFKKP